MIIGHTHSLPPLFSMCGAGWSEGRMGNWCYIHAGYPMLLLRGEKQRFVGNLIAHTEKPGAVCKRTNPSDDKLGCTCMMIIARCIMLVRYLEKKKTVASTEYVSVIGSKLVCAVIVPHTGPNTSALISCTVISAQSSATFRAKIQNSKMPHSLPGRCPGIDKAALPPSTFHFPSDLLHQNIVT